MGADDWTVAWTPEEVSRCNHVDNLKLIVRGGVYDVTSFASQHPGGVTLLRVAAGRDATALFESYHLDLDRVQRVLSRLKVGVLAPGTGASKFPSYSKPSPFFLDLKRATRTYLARAGDRRCGRGPSQVLRVVTLTAGVIGPMMLALSVSWTGPCLAVLCAALSGVFRALMGLHVLHDASHAALGNVKSLWHVLGAYGNDFINGTSYYCWLHQHIILHHCYTNVHGVDMDFESSPVFRLSPEQPLYYMHRFQHLYALPLYGLVALSNRIGDLVAFFTRQYGIIPLAPPTVIDSAVFFGGKLWFLTYQCIIPLAAGVHPGRIALQLAVSDYIGGLYLGTAFACSHVANGVNFLDAGSTSTERCWAKDQVCTTQDYALDSKIISMLTGNLSHQITHHLFPGLSQFHYPGLAPLVQQVCVKHDVPFLVRPSLTSALQAHFSHLRRMGRG